MRPNLPRGKASAPGVFYSNARTPLALATDAKTGELVQQDSDPRGYFLGQYTSSKAPSRRDKHRAAVAAAKASSVR